MKGFSSDSVSLTEFVTRSEKLINELGVTLKCGSDFEVFRFLADQSDRDYPLDPIFDPIESNIEHVPGRWLVGYNRNGDVIQTQAMRMLDLKGSTLLEFFKNDLRQLRPYGHKIEPEKTYWRLSKSASEISGQVCYHGGLWIHKNFRGGCFASLVTRYLTALTLLELEPDYLIGLQAPFTACKGLSVREGYMHLEQQSILWHSRHTKEIIEDWLAWMSADDAAFNLAIPPETFWSLFESPIPPLTATA